MTVLQGFLYCFDTMLGCFTFKFWCFPLISTYSSLHLRNAHMLCSLNLHHLTHLHVCRFTLRLLPSYIRLANSKLYLSATLAILLMHSIMEFHYPNYWFVWYEVKDQLHPIFILLLLHRVTGFGIFRGTDVTGADLVPIMFPDCRTGFLMVVSILLLKRVHDTYVISLYFSVEIIDHASNNIYPC